MARSESLVTVMLVAFLSLAIVVPSYQDELYTAVVHMEKLLDTERNVVNVLQRYLEAEEKRMNGLRQMLHHYDLLNSVASNDVESYLSNPVNAYLLVKRLTTDWKLVELLIDSDRKDVFHYLLENETFPSSEDLSGAADALLRLQDTYNLDTTMLADGVIPIRDTRPLSSQDRMKPLVNTLSLTSNDCYELGRQAYYNEDYHHAKAWMREALQRKENEQTSLDASQSTADRVDILEHLAFSQYKLGFIQEAYELSLQILAYQPEHERAKMNLVYYEKELQETQPRKAKKGDDGDEEMPTENTISESKWPIEESERQTYEALCRGENRMSERVRSKLVCFHLDTRHADPYIRLFRIKVEEAYKRPQIVMFHEFMSDQEIEIVKSLAKPNLKRATVQNYFTGTLEVAKYRISKSAWLSNRMHEVVKRISRRVQAYTGLDLSTGEELQVVNYGIGGHYEPHYDFARREEKHAFASLGTGNRIATWLNYMSDVAAGGATVFPQLGVTLWPKKNSAAFWYNLYKSGEGDLLTRHAACPVLVGSKWVSNKWMHERAQEWRKPCGLSRTEPNIVQST